MATQPSKRVPPLAWLIGALVVLVLVWALTQWKGSYQTPSGGPTVAEGQAGGGNPLPPQEPYTPGPAPPPAPTGAGPTNEPGVLSQPPTTGGGR